MIDPAVRNRRSRKWKRWECGRGHGVVTGRAGHLRCAAADPDRQRQSLLAQLGSPTTTGSIERFHRSLRAEFLGSKRLLSMTFAPSNVEARDMAHC